jgi:hypothetical protein
VLAHEAAPVGAVVQQHEDEEDALLGAVGQPEVVDDGGRVAGKLQRLALRGGVAVAAGVERHVTPVTERFECGVGGVEGVGCALHDLS